MKDIQEESILKDVIIHEDNQGCISVAQNEVVNDRTKHVDVKVQMIMDNVKRGAVRLQYISTNEMTADILTKALPKSKFVKFVVYMGIRS